MKQAVWMEFQYRCNGKDYYRLYVQQDDGSIRQGLRTLQSFTGSTLKQKAKDLQDEIDRGVWKVQ